MLWRVSQVQTTGPTPRNANHRSGQRSSGSWIGSAHLLSGRDSAHPSSSSPSVVPWLETAVPGRSPAPSVPGRALSSATSRFSRSVSNQSRRATGPASTVAASNEPFSRSSSHDARLRMRSASARSGGPSRVDRKRVSTPDSRAEGISGSARKPGRRKKRAAAGSGDSGRRSLAAVVSETSVVSSLTSRSFFRHSALRRAAEAGVRGLDCGGRGGLFCCRLAWATKKERKATSETMVTATHASAASQKSSQDTSMASLEAGARMPAMQVTLMMMMTMDRQSEAPRANFCRSLIWIWAMRRMGMTRIRISVRMSSAMMAAL